MHALAREVATELAQEFGREARRALIEAIDEEVQSTSVVAPTGELRSLEKVGLGVELVAAVEVEALVVGYKRTDALVRLLQRVRLAEAGFAEQDEALRREHGVEGQRVGLEGRKQRGVMGEALAVEVDWLAARHDVTDPGDARLGHAVRG